MLLNLSSSHPSLCPPTPPPCLCLSLPPLLSLQSIPFQSISFLLSLSLFLFPTLSVYLFFSLIISLVNSSSTCLFVSASSTHAHVGASLFFVLLPGVVRFYLRGGKGALCILTCLSAGMHVCECVFSAHTSACCVCVWASKVDANYYRGLSPFFPNHKQTAAVLQ